MNFPNHRVWIYCIYLESDSEFDYGVYVAPNGDVSNAIVYGNSIDEYISGPIDIRYTSKEVKSNLQRWTNYWLDRL